MSFNNLTMTFKYYTSRKYFSCWTQIILHSVPAIVTAPWFPKHRSAKHVCFPNSLTFYMFLKIWCLSQYTCRWTTTWSKPKFQTDCMIKERDRWKRTWKQSNRLDVEKHNKKLLQLYQGINKNITVQNALTFEIQNNDNLEVMYCCNT